MTNYPTQGPDCALAPSTGLASHQGNLVCHLVQVATQMLAATDGAPELSGLCVTYLDALQHLAHIIDPGFMPTVLNNPPSASRFLYHLRELWEEVVVGGADPQRSEQACSYAHQLLVRMPTFTAYYVSECARSFRDPQLALDLLAQTSRFVTMSTEGALVERAQAYAMKVVLHQKQLALPLWNPTKRQSPATVQPKTTLTPMPDHSNTMIMTASHRAAFETLTSTGELFFQPISNATQLKLRLYLLLVGPTGAGKSFLVRKAASELNASYFKVTRGDWIVLGSKAGRPTVFQILDRLLGSKRLVLHFDELDKFTIDFKNEWSACVGADLWNILDGHFQVHEYVKETKFEADPAPTIEQIERKIRSSLWIVGSGTWQDVFRQATGAFSVGFNAGVTPGKVTTDSIAQSGVISPELLHRFNSDLVFLNYPTTDETLSLLRSTGIVALASDLGIPVAADDVNWSRGGMRVLETIATSLMVEKFRRAKLARSEPSVTTAAA